MITLTMIILSSRLGQLKLLKKNLSSSFYVSDAKYNFEITQPLLGTILEKCEIYRHHEFDYKIIIDFH